MNIKLSPVCCQEFCIEHKLQCGCSCGYKGSKYDYHPLNTRCFEGRNKHYHSVSSTEKCVFLGNHLNQIYEIVSKEG